MPSFFTLPASQKKRKRDVENAPTTKKRRAKDSKANAAPTSKAPNRTRDDSISGSDSEQEGDHGISSAESSSGDSDSEGETAAERRLRLAERYLSNIKEQVQEEGFDAEDIDKEIIASRLKEDVAETKGRMYRRLAASLRPTTARQAKFGSCPQPVTAIAGCGLYVYTVTKDIVLTKWKIAKPPPPVKPILVQTSQGTSGQPRKDALKKRPTKVRSTRGDKSKAKEVGFQHHTAAILAVAASEDGKYVCTGGADNRVIIWSATDLKPLKIFSQHRDAVMGLSFRLGTNQLYSCSRDRTIKVWSLDELAYIETLFGHQDEVVDVASLALERCVSVGARDRTVRLWKVVEEQQLVFRGGTLKHPKSLDLPRDDLAKTLLNDMKQMPLEGSIDRVAMVDESTFLTGSDNGTLALWDINKKKPVYTIPLAHGVTRADPTSSEDTADDDHPRGHGQPCWITALATLPLTDIAVSGSWDGRIRVWQISEDKRSLRCTSTLGPGSAEGAIRGVVNDLQIMERGHRWQDGICVLAAIGREHRLGRWKRDSQWVNGGIVYELVKHPA